MIKVYLAGGMKSGWQKRVAIDGPPATYIDPCDHGLGGEVEYTTWDLFGIDQADVIFVYFEAGNPSGYGLCLEAGYARARGKVIVLVDEKSAVDPVIKRRLGMLRSVASVVFTELAAGIEFLHRLAIVS